MLNRHGIVLYLGITALVLLRGFPDGNAGPIGLAFLCLVAGLLLDPGLPSTRADLAHVLQASAAVLLLWNAGLLARRGFGDAHLWISELGIALGVIGLICEMRLPYKALRAAVGLQALGDLLFLGAFVLAVFDVRQKPSTVGWVFIVLAGLLSAYAAVANLVLQVARLRNLQAGWRFRVLELNAEGLKLKTLDGDVRLQWRHVESARTLDARHLLLVLPSPLPVELARAGLPVEELRTAEEPTLDPNAPPPERFALVLHEQELGAPLTLAEQTLAQYLPAPRAG